MEIVVAKEPPKGFDLSITVPSKYPEELLIGDLNQIINPVTGSHPDKKRVQIWLENARESDTEQLKKLSFSPYRDLLQMRCQLPTPLEGLETRPFHRGIDETSFLEVNSRAFHWHPEQGTLNIEKLTDIFQEDWFEEKGFRLYEIDGKLAGFCWTKIHFESTGNIGEIFAIAVDPKFHGKGLGKPLTVSGLQHIASKGITSGMLYVESDNLPAIHVYNQIGFRIHTINRAFHNQQSK